MIIWVDTLLITKVPHERTACGVNRVQERGPGPKGLLSRAFCRGLNDKYFMDAHKEDSLWSFIFLHTTLTLNADRRHYKVEKLPSLFTF